MGAWFEAQVVKVTTDPVPSSSNESNGESHTNGDDLNIIYHVKFDE